MPCRSWTGAEWSTRRASPSAATRAPGAFALELALCLKRCLAMRHAKDAQELEAGVKADAFELAKVARSVRAATAH